MLRIMPLIWLLGCFWAGSGTEEDGIYRVWRPFTADEMNALLAQLPLSATTSSPSTAPTPPKTTTEDIRLVLGIPHRFGQRRNRLD